MSRFGVWVGAGLLLLGCGGRAKTDGAPEADAASGGGGMAAGGAKSEAGSGPSTPSLVPLPPRLTAPSVDGDGRLPDIPETSPGGRGIGWDTCVAGEMVSSRIDCDGCSASRGSEFLVVEGTLEADIDSLKPQLYFYFKPPQGAGALWFDLTLLSGIPYAELSVWETDSYCAPVSEQRLYDVSALLEEGAWSSGCIPLDPGRPLQGVGLRLGAAGRIGLDAIRFGGGCP